MASDTSGSASGTVLAPSTIMAPMRSPRRVASTRAACSRMARRSARGTGCPTGLSGAGHVERTAHLLPIGEGVAIGDALDARAVAHDGLAAARDQGAPDLEVNGLGRALAPAVDHGVDPRAVGGDRPVRVGLVRERARLGYVRRSERLHRAILFLARRVGEAVDAFEGREEAVALTAPVRGALLEAEDVAEEIVLRGVLVEAAHEIGDGAVEILRAHHRRIEKEPAGACLDRTSLMVGHPFQHLELDKGHGTLVRAQEETVGHVEEVVGGDAEMHGPR